MTSAEIYPGIDANQLSQVRSDLENDGALVENHAYVPALVGLLGALIKIDEAQKNMPVDRDFRGGETSLYPLVMKELLAVGLDESQVAATVAIMKNHGMINGLVI